MRNDSKLWFPFLQKHVSIELHDKKIFVDLLYPLDKSSLSPALLKLNFGFWNFWWFWNFNRKILKLKIKMMEIFSNFLFEFFENLWSFFWNSFAIFFWKFFSFFGNFLVFLKSFWSVFGMFLGKILESFSNVFRSS